MTELVTVEVLSTEPAALSQFDYDRMITDPHAREWAESAAGFITFGLGQAVVKVLEAGNLLIEAKQRLPHGEYLPWVQQACGLSASRAGNLIKAASWVANLPHEANIDNVSDVNTLFMLSADTTTEEVREWFMERCAAGDPPSRKEVQDRKRSAGAPRQPQPTEAMALAMIRKGEVDRLREALALAERAEVVAAAQVMAEQRLRELGKLRYIAGMDADFHRMKDGSWIRLPHAGDVEVSVVEAPAVEMSEPEPESHSWDAAPLLSLHAAAERLGITKTSLNSQLTPAFAARRNGAPLIRKGFKVTREGRGMVRLTPVEP
jgi:hypothetical protein